jgi:hypothetical protein
MCTKKYNNHDENTPLVTAIKWGLGFKHQQTWWSSEDQILNTNNHDNQTNRRFLRFQDYGDGGNHQWDHLKAPTSMMNMMIRWGPSFCNL